MNRGWKIVLTGIAVVGLAGAARAPEKAPRKQLIAPSGVKPTGLPFSPGLMVGDTLYLSGVVGADANGKLAAGGFEPEMRQAMANAHAVLQAGGLDFADVVAVNVYLADMKDFGQLNQIYREYFKTEPLPVRATVAVSGLALGAKMEISMTAARTSK
ncbi:MAG TPA: RidA family protein [Patescibacteria group bacterium]|nr:RidA family protein [Patescibacteria group bacterium]